MATPSKGPALLYVAHRLDAGVLAGWTALHRSCAGRGFHPVFLYDNSRGDFVRSAELAGADCFLFTFADLGTVSLAGLRPAASPRPRQRDLSDPGLSSRRGPNTPATGASNMTCSSTVSGATSSPLSRGTAPRCSTTTLYRPPVRPDWGWWPTLGKPWHEWRSLQRVRAFMPIARLTPKALLTLERAYGKGGWAMTRSWCQVSCKSYGLTIADLRGRR